MRRRVFAVVIWLCMMFAGCGDDQGPPGQDAEAISKVGIRDRPQRRAKHDEQSIRQMLEEHGASGAQAKEIVDTLSRRLTPNQMHVWLSHPEKSHPVPDPDSAKQFEDKGLVPAVLNWTAVNAVSAGKTDLVIMEARRFAENG